MDEDDEITFKVINSKSSLSEDQFEEVMSFFEETVAIEQPYAGLSTAPVVSLDDLLKYVTDSTPDSVRQFSNIIYEHWSTRRTNKTNISLPPQLKFESGQESDDSDPYVCFRRREVRQARKTRGRDQQAADKLRKLRFEMESARAILQLVKRREESRRDQIEGDKQVFEQRQAFRELKRKLKQPGDDDLLITQKKPKLPTIVPPNEQLQQIIARPQPELKTIEDLRVERGRAIEAEIQLNVDKHIRWNDGYVDKTMYPLSPEPEFHDAPQFLPAMPAEYLPTPPASVSEDESAEKDVEMKDVSRSSTPFRYASPADEDDHPAMPAFRRRIGRGGRVIVDRKFPVRSRIDERFRFDHSDEEDDSSFDDSFTALATRQSNERSLLYQSAIRDQHQANQRRFEQASGGTPVKSSTQSQPVVSVPNS